MIKKNVPYKALKIIWAVVVLLVIINIVSVWVAWSGKETETEYGVWGRVVFGIVSGTFALVSLIAAAVAAFLNQKTEVRLHGWAYALLAVIHLVFVILVFTLVKKGDNAVPALFTVFLVAILGVCAYFALKSKPQGSIFGGKRNKEEGLNPIRREDLGSNPTEATVDQVANPENNPDRKAGRDEKTGIVSL